MNFKCLLVFALVFALVYVSEANPEANPDPEPRRFHGRYVDRGIKGANALAGLGGVIVDAIRGG